MTRSSLPTSSRSCTKETPRAGAGLRRPAGHATSFYSIENSYREIPKETVRVTCRGALFGECYDRYLFELPGTEGGVNVICPKTPAAGNPWVYRAGFVERDAVVDLALLAKGFHIVTAPMGYNYDGPQPNQWAAVYQHMVKNGFSAKPVIEGAGGAAGEMYVWAVANPEKVSCVYAENPVLHGNIARQQPIDNLAPLAKAKVPLLHVCGSLDPAFATQTQVVEKRYKELGGEITVIVKEGEGHYPLGPKDPKPVVEFHPQERQVTSKS